MVERSVFLTAILVAVAPFCSSSAAALSEAEAKGLRLAKTTVSDDYENDSLKREGNPSVFRAPISNGLLEYTMMAKYVAEGTLEFGFPRRRFFVPKDGRKFFAFGFRLYSAEGESAEILCSSSSGGFSARFSSGEDGRIVCTAVDGCRKSSGFDIPATMLPVDVMLCARRDGGYSVVATSLADSSVRTASGDAGFFREEADDGFDVSVGVKKASLVIDNLFAGEVQSSGADATSVAFVAPERMFSPERAGWKKVFEDDFDGAEMDWSKWYQTPWSKHKDFAALDGEGHLAIKCDFEPGTTNLVSSGVHSRQTFTFGYVEARVKLTRNNGWWAAFWLYGTSSTNPGVDGSEIDIMEDYYTRAATPDGPNRPILDHNLHVSVGKALQSWQYRSEHFGTIDDWRVIGCKWTPFEISYYADGKLIGSSANHSPYDGVVFDAANHAALECPLHIIFSGSIMRSWGRRNTAGFKFPEFFKVDYVRFWEYPKDDSAQPRVAWKDSASVGERIAVSQDARVAFEAEVFPSPATKAPIKELFLFDCGHPVAVRTAPPWRFEIPFTEEYYRTTRYMAPGRSGKSPPWDSMAHAFRLYVRDVEGRVASADGVRWRIPAGSVKSAPWRGRPHKLPCTILPWQFDEGGRGSGHHSLVSEPRTKGAGNLPLLRGDTAFDCRANQVMSLKTGEWMNYTVDVATGGTFRATLKFGTGNDFPNRVILLVDGVRRGEFDCPWPGKWDWGLRMAKPIEDLKLTSGRHMLTLMVVGYLSVGAFTLDFVGR